MRDVMRLAVMGVATLMLMCLALRGSGTAAEKMDAMQLIEMAKANSPGSLQNGLASAKSRAKKPGGRVASRFSCDLNSLKK